MLINFYKKLKSESALLLSYSRLYFNSLLKKDRLVKLKILWYCLRFFILLPIDAEVILRVHQNIFIKL